jgi:hypothetical protein
VYRSCRFVGVILACVLVVPWVHAARTLSYVDILRQLTDLDRLMYWEEGIRAGQASSYDRRESESWGSNGDAGQYIRVEEDGAAVMAEIEGPGCIYRIWSANPQGQIRFYFDGAQEPQYEFEFNKLFTGEIPPFDRPIVYKRGEPQSASDCYLPIPFAKSIKITADRRHGQYYHFGYLQFPKDWQVPTFRLPLTEEEQAALEAAKQAWSNCGRDPKPVLPGQTTVAKSQTIAPGGRVVLADLRGPGIIRAIRAKARSQQRYFWRKLVLRGVWDGAQWPQLLTPLGPFFGFDWTQPAYKSLVAGSDPEGWCYFYYPIPFRKSARLDLKSYLAKPADVDFEVDWAPVKTLPDNTMYFFARWRHEPRCSTFDYPFLETAGRGKFVGVTLQINHPVPGWWGEGDEKVWIDDDQFPRWIGTGSEDYFGDAWGIRYLPEPSFGCSLREGARTCPYRWHFMDYIPFSQRLRMTIENYPSEVGGPAGAPPWEDDYSSVAYWYQAEIVPPFQDLQGCNYTGGAAPGQKPAQFEYRPDVFSDITLDLLRTFGCAVPYTIEAEQVLAELVASGKAKVVEDALLPYEFNLERAVDFGEVREGDLLGEFDFDALERVVYYPVLFTAPQDGVADLTIETEGGRPDIVGRPKIGQLELSGVYLDKGRHRVRLVALSEGRAVLDCIQMNRAQRASGAIEAEDLQVLRISENAEKPHPSSPMLGVSAGRILQWRPTAPGQGMVLSLDVQPEREYVLGVRPMLGPEAGIIQAFVGNKPLGPPHDLYAPASGLSPQVLPLGQLPKTNKEFEIRVVGKNEQSMDYRVDIDYLCFEPAIIGPESAQGVWAQVLKTDRCQYRIQNLGSQWFAGHHLWVQPSSNGAYIDLGINVPAEGDYEIVVRYTTSWDYAVVTAFLDGKALGSPTDCYTPEVLLTQPISLGRVHLAPGQHVLRFQATGKNEASKGFLMGIDYVSVKKAR